ncbi:enoyl-CoA hydratase/isomerase family protein [uncultured Cohaesibacter sp.]|uniref:enoyl-CoA hydratase/isomerase family protein n=1 Tax=uncultured Cohaesibacter sp. TaxID=1002546 RepID=UPI00292DA569|nr:enoyl-CoA hydratase/isomerase family protein [uncultured Cohaesibacter sp.]
MSYKFDKSVPYRTYLENYQECWRDLAYLKREDGILEVRFHWNDGPWRWNEAMHGALIPFFADISHDPDNECIIITGTGDSFLNQFDAATAQPATDRSKLVTYDWWWTVQTRMPGALIDIPVPVVAAINGPVSIHPEIVLLSDIVIASDKTVIVDRHLKDAGLVPTDGTNILYDELFGHNLARSALYMGTEIGPERAQELGIFTEVHPIDKVLERAWEVARNTIMPVPRIHRRMAREGLIQPFREAYAKAIRASMAHECYAAEAKPSGIPKGEGL